MSECEPGPHKLQKRVIRFRASANSNLCARLGEQAQLLQQFGRVTPLAPQPRPAAVSRSALEPVDHLVSVLFSGSFVETK